MHIQQKINLKITTQMYFLFYRVAGWSFWTTIRVPKSLSRKKNMYHCKTITPHSEFNDFILNTRLSDNIIVKITLRRLLTPITNILSNEHRDESRISLIIILPDFYSSCFFFYYY